jgi:DNA-binding response OmpR family regulator
MSDQIKVLLVEHEEQDIVLLEQMLNNGYIVSSLDDSSNIIKRAATIHPDIAIINPTMRGLPTKILCAKLKSLQPPCYVLFLSSDNTAQSCTRAHADGADDYILKPFNPIEVHEKIQVSIQKIEIQKQLIKASDTARIAIENSFELGTIITFMEAIRASEDFDELSMAFFTAVEDFGANLSLQIRCGDGALNFRCANDSLEAVILGEFRDNAKSIEHANKIIIHHDKISLLLKDLPPYNSMKYGRLKDHINIMVNSAGARIVSLDLQIELAERKEQEIKQALQKAGKIKTLFKTTLAEHQKTTNTRIANFERQMESVFISLSLDYQQEELLLKSMHSLLSNFSDSTALQTMMNNNLNELLADMNQLQED